MRQKATQDEFGNWDLDPLYEELMDRLECEAPEFDQEEEESVACGECDRCKDAGNPVRKKEFVIEFPATNIVLSEDMPF